MVMIMARTPSLNASSLLLFIAGEYLKLIYIYLSRKIPVTYTMNLLYILLAALWTYPVICWLFFFFTKRHVLVRNKVFRISLVVAGITVLSMAVGVCTRFNIVNCMLVTVFYFIVIYLCWWTQFVSRVWVNWLGIIPLGIVLLLGYFIGSIGVLGLVFAADKYQLKHELWVNNRLSVKIYKDSHALSDRRTARYEVYTTISWMPLLQRKIGERTYDKLIVILADKPAINYIPGKEEICFHVSMQDFKTKKMVCWTDTMQLRK